MEVKNKIQEVQVGGRIGDALWRILTEDGRRNIFARHCIANLL